MTAPRTPPAARQPFGQEARWIDATETARRVRAGEATALEVIDAAIARAERIDPQLSALSWRRFEEARVEAAALDATPIHARGAFAGVPYLVKDLTDLAGAPTTFGSRLFDSYVARSDDAVVAAARAAGMIAVGKSATPEFGLLPTTEPQSRAPTRNPWDAALSAGGSSGGAAAAVAAGIVPIAQASDGGGSIRIPAALCGLVGLKPSRGRGLAPKRQGPGGLSVTFAVSRSVRDSASFLDVLERWIAEHGGGDRIRARELVGRVEGPSARRLRVGVLAVSAIGRAPEDETADALERAVALMARLGHAVEPVSVDLGGEDAADHFLALWASVPHGLRQRFALVRVIARGLKPWRWPSWDGAMEPWTRGLADWFLHRQAEIGDPIRRALRYFEEAAPRYLALFERFDVLMSPVLSTPRLPLGLMGPQTPFETMLERAVDVVGYTPVQNVLGLPAISLPIVWDEAGRPIGVHFVAPAFDERTLLGLAFELEAAVSWADRRPPLDVGEPSGLGAA